MSAAAVPVLDARVGLTVGALAVDATLRADPGEVLALVGPNGAGKTTVLRAIAGLAGLAHGHVRLDGAVVADPAAGVHAPPQARRVGVVFQDRRLFPALDARDNVAFGLQARGRSRADARAEAERWLSRFGLGARADARPHELSGGEAQAVALARALAVEPRLLLLDEPFSALDVQRRSEARAALLAQLADFDGAVVLVTHDPLDALVLAERIVILEGGRVTQEGATVEVVARPRSRYAADLVGVNLLVGARIDAHRAAVEGTGAVLTVAEPLPADDVVLTCRAQAVALFAERPVGSPRNVWAATVGAVEGDRDRVRVRLDGPVPVTAEVTPAAVAELGLRPGAPVWAAIKAAELAATPR